MKNLVLVVLTIFTFCFGTPYIARAQVNQNSNSIELQQVLQNRTENEKKISSSVQSI